MRRARRAEGAVGDLEQRLQAVWMRLVSGLELRGNCGSRDCCFSRSRKNLPMTCVASPSTAPGDGTTTACAEKSGMRSGRTTPPLVCGLTPMRRVPSGARPVMSGIKPGRRHRTVPPGGRSGIHDRPAARRWRRLSRVGDRHLVGAPGALQFQSIHLLGTGPALRRAQHDHRPARTLDCKRPACNRFPRAAGSCALLDVGDRRDGPNQARRQRQGIAAGSSPST